jgi:hypothetical protein
MDILTAFAAAPAYFAVIYVLAGERAGKQEGIF